MTAAGSSTVSSPLAEEARQVAGDALQAALVDLVELSLIAKQAHWNVVGRSFRSLHQQLDEVVDQARLFTDTVAERAVAIGVSPSAQTEALARQSQVAPLKTGYLPVDDVIEAFVERLAAMVARFRERLEATADADPVTQDLFIEITAELEKTKWMFEAER